MSATAPNLNAVNETIAFLSNAVAETESKLKTEEEKRKKLTKECDLLSNEIQNKAMEITQLRKENDELIKENTDLKQKLDKNDKEIEDLSLFKSIHEKQNYDFLMEQKKKVELEKIEIKESCDDALLAIIGNKKDLYEEEQINEEDAIKKAESFNATFGLTSALEEDTGFDEIITKVIKTYIQNKGESVENKLFKTNSNNFKLDSSTFKEKNKKKKKFC